MNKTDLDNEIVGALGKLGGGATIVDICKEIWTDRAADLQTSGDLFFTWQYDVRWAANRLRRSGVLRPAEESPRGVWELSS
jgi:hypothetical protein